MEVVCARLDEISSFRHLDGRKSGQAKAGEMNHDSVYRGGDGRGFFGGGPGQGGTCMLP